MTGEAEKQVRQVAAPVPDLKETVKPQGTDLSADQQNVMDAVIAQFSEADYELPKTDNGKLTDEEKCWLSYECVLRYLRATKWAGPLVAIERLEKTLKWRREFGLYDTPCSTENVEPEAVTGKEIIFGYDVVGRPALYLLPSRQNTEESIRQVQFTVFMLERCIDLMGPGVESIALMINYGDKAKNPSMSQSRRVLDILQTHYPERLGLAIIINVPWLLHAFYKLITPFIDPVTREKMRFNPQVVEEGLFTAEQVWEDFGGDIKFEYEHEKYWPDFVEMAEKRRQAMMDRWRALGAKVGLREWDMKNGNGASEEVKGSPIVIETEPAPVAIEA